MKDYKELWKLLKKNLKLEISLCGKAHKKAEREKSYHDADLFREEEATVEWVLSQMEHLEETGEIL